MVEEQIKALNSEVEKIGCGPLELSLVHIGNKWHASAVGLVHLNADTQTQARSEALNTFKAILWTALEELEKLD
jgi:hypothetical protein